MRYIIALTLLVWIFAVFVRCWADSRFIRSDEQVQTDTYRSEGTRIFLPKWRKYSNAFDTLGFLFVYSVKLRNHELQLSGVSCTLPYVMFSVYVSVWLERTNLTDITQLFMKKNTKNVRHIKYESNYELFCPLYTGTVQETTVTANECKRKELNLIVTVGVWSTLFTLNAFTDDMLIPIIVMLF